MHRSRLLVETDWLAEHLQDPHLRVVDMRGYVRTVEHDGVQEALYVGAREEYEQGHIPGAIYVDWSSDIVDPNDAVEAQVAPAARFAEVLGNLGIGDQHQVVVYDSHPSSQFATRMWWALNYYGHNQVVVLNGGFNKWVRESRPLETLVKTYKPALLTPIEQPQLRATAQDVLGLIGKEGTTMVDAREAAQFTGETTRGHGRPGHIPGALNIPRESMIDPETGTFRNDEELKRIFDEAGVDREKQIVAYCNGGVAATTLLFSLAMLGYPKLTNYDGSWNEWGSRQDLPTEI